MGRIRRGEVSVWAYGRGKVERTQHVRGVLPDGTYGTYGRNQLVSVTCIEPIRFGAPSASEKKQIIS